MNLKLLIFIFLVLLLTNQSYALCVKSSRANLRSGPGTKYEKTWEVYKYMPFRKLALKRSWYKIRDVDNDIHWIHKKLVTEKGFCAVVKVSEANIRKGPGTNYNKVYFSPALQYYTFKVLKIKRDWVKVKDDKNNIGWIFRRLLWVN